MQKILSPILPTGCSSPKKRSQRRLTTHLALCGLASLAAGWIGSAHAGEHFYDFNPPNGDPNNPASGFVLFGSNTNGWQTNGGFTGVEGDGFLEITPAVNGQTLGILFPLDYFTNADNSLTALPLKGFLLECDVRVGNATGNNGRPADGFSISFASSQDPVVFWGKQGQFRGWGGGDSAAQAVEPSSFNFATGTGSLDPAPCDSGTAENGTKTGVSVQFDTWSGNRILDQNGADAADNVGWRVHYNGKMVQRILSQPPSGPLAQSPDPGGADVNGLAVCPAAGAPADFSQDPSCEAAICADTNSIQTGPYYADEDGNHSGSTSNLCWAHLSVELTTNSPHVLTVTYKGRALVDHVAITNFAPYVGQLIMGGRTGGANENRDIDNVHILTYPAVQSVYGGVSSASLYMNDVSLLLQNVGPAKVTAINSLTLDGVDIKAAPGTTITLADPNSTIKYAPAAPFPSGSVHTLIVNWTDAGGNTQSQQVGFTTLQYVVMPASAAVASVDTTAPGFLLQPYQNASSEPNRMYWADEQLEGLHGTNYIDFGPLSTVNGNQIQWNDVIDFANAGAGGQFPLNNDWSAVGIPAGGLINDNNSAMAITAYLYFPQPGTYVMGGNSDDSLRVTFAKNDKDVLGTTVPGLNAEGGRGIGSFQNIGAVVITNAGYYGFRMLWENGGGGSAVEWYTTSTPAGTTNVLINDVQFNPQYAVAAYQSSSVAPPYVSFAEPPLNDDQFSPDTPLKWQLTDGATTVNSGSVALMVNGAAQSPTVNNAAGVTTVTQAPPAGTGLWPVGTNTISLTFKDSGGADYAYNYSFVVQPYAVLDPSQAAPLGGQDTTKPGFAFTDAQIDFAAAGDTGDGAPNQSDYANALMAGLWFPTYGANASKSTGPQTTPLIDYAINGSTGDFTNNFLMPGIPGTPNNTDNIGALFKFWLVFPQAGFYKLGVSSDDGFRVSEGLAPTRQVLHVSGSGIDKDVGAVVSTTVDGNGGFGVPPPVVPISAPVVFLPTSVACPITTDLTGKIAVAYAGTCGDDDAHLVLELQNKGAVGAIIINKPNNGFPYTMGGSAGAPITIPAVNVSGYKGDDSIWTNANLTASIGASQAIELGGADYGKGMGWVDFGVAVPQAGVYPLNMIWYNGGGGAGVEFASIQPDGTRILVNDTSNPNALLAFQAATGVTQRHTVSVSHTGGNVVITYTGTLFSSPTVDGSYTAVTGASSPYTVPSGGPAAQFFRAH